MREAQMVEASEAGAEEEEAAETEVGAIDLSDVYPTAETEQTVEEQPAAR